MTKSAKIRRLLNKNTKPIEIAKKLKVKPNLVYQVAWHAKKANKKKKATYKSPRSKLIQAVFQANRDIEAVKAKPLKEDKKALAWAKNNPWFGKSKPRTAYALGLHEELVRSGVDPKSDEYYKRIDEGMSIFANGKQTKKHRMLSAADYSSNVDVVNNPPHYKTGGIEVLDFIEAKDLNYRLGNVVKYVSRAGKKINSDPVQDLEKARFYLEREIEARKQA